VLAGKRGAALKEQRHHSGCGNLEKEERSVVARDVHKCLGCISLQGQSCMFSILMMYTQF
jgi:hypothetical protein